jgi:hypothetical protein
VNHFQRRTLLFAAALALSLVWTTGCRLGAGRVEVSSAPVPVAAAGEACRYWCEVRTQPRPLRIHVLAVDLASGRLGLEALVAPDPDGAGPAEAGLVKPQALLAGQPDMIAAVNANPFSGLPDAAGRRSSNWHAGMPVEIAGWARHQGQDASQPQAGHDNFWIDGGQRAHVAGQADPIQAREAVAGFKMLLQDGQVVADGNPARHPRTAVGTDHDRQRVWLVVVDGRQSGYSEGVTCFELAGIMKTLGCREALNLDGGGSAVMFRADAQGRLQVANRPSGGETRPIPVLLVVRKK